MNEYFWDTQIDYLKSTREQMWNDDYFEFLVKSVWKLNDPIKVVDFGCGYGYLGMKLLPLLPNGSTYTGIDMGEELLDEARRLFKDAPFCTEFIRADLINYEPESQFDLAICQAVLRHIPKSKIILKKMIESISSNGMVICIEVNRRMENAGVYIEGFEYDIVQKDLSLNKQWESELHNGGRDYMTGIKIPIYMEQLGLKNVAVRINDYVEFVNPIKDKDKYNEHIDSFMKSNGFHDVKDYESNSSALSARCLLISFGTK